MRDPNGDPPDRNVVEAVRTWPTLVGALWRPKSAGGTGRGTDQRTHRGIKWPASRAPAPLAIARREVLVQPGDDLVDRLDSLAIELGISRSELLGDGRFHTGAPRSLDGDS